MPSAQHQERNNPDYDFLFRPQSKEHSYYRWRLFSLANGDEMLKWRKEPFQMLVAGPRWIPPPPEDNALAHQRAHRRQQAADPVSGANAQVAGGEPSLGYLSALRRARSVLNQKVGGGSGGNKRGGIVFRAQARVVVSGAVAVFV